MLVLQTATALGISFAICKTVSYFTKLYRIQGGMLPGVTAIVVVLATLFPSQFRNLAPAGDTIALILMQVHIYIPQERSFFSFAALVSWEIFHWVSQCSL